MNDSSRREAGERAFQAGKAIAELVREKNSAYGDAAALQLGLWTTLLQQYRVGDEYHIPVALFDHVPRLTRVFDRIARIVANPISDSLGEDPWKDMAGDAIVGIIMPRTPPPRGCVEPTCELPEGHKGSHRSMHSGMLKVWPIRVSEPGKGTLFMEGEAQPPYNPLEPSPQLGEEDTPHLVLQPTPAANGSSASALPDPWDEFDRPLQEILPDPVQHPHSLPEAFDRDTADDSAFEP